MQATARRQPGPPSITFEEVYGGHFSWVYRTLRRLGARERDLEDLAHDVFVVVYRKLDAYDPARPLRPWLFGICFRVVSDYRQRARFSRETVTAPQDLSALRDLSAGGAPEQERAVTRAEQRALVLSALDVLSLEQRAVFVLHELDGASIPEIARSLDVSNNTLYSRLRLARAKFAAAIADHTHQDASRSEHRSEHRGHR